MLTPLPLEALSRHLVKILLSEEALRFYEQGAIPHAYLQHLAEHLKSFSASYVEESRKSITAKSEGAAIAYALYFLPVNFAKMFTLLSHLPQSFCPRTILDYGAGPGTATLAAHYFSSLEQATITLCDSSAEMLGIAQKVLSPLLPLQISYKESSSPPTGNYDLIFLSNILNELPLPQAQSLITRLVSQLSLQGKLIVLEPALRSTTQALMELRDSTLAQDPQVSVLFPCVHNNPCPMRKISPQDWCHGTLHWEAPLLVRQLDTLTGFNKHRIKYSALILSREEAPHSPDLFRIITPPEKTHRGVRATVCSSTFFGDLLLSKKERDEENRAFQRCIGYDLVSITPTPNLGILKKGMRVKRV